jgi:hypothetical protein
MWVPPALPVGGLTNGRIVLNLLSQPDADAALWLTPSEER